MKYFIYWKSVNTKYESYGKCIFEDKKDVEKMAEELNDKWMGEIIHKYSSEPNYEYIIKNLSKQF
tara:strand:+ start:6763 stop:6957 length:195 start_codon:yes stop_codon:yes gene_type:complete